MLAAVDDVVGLLRQRVSALDAQSINAVGAADRVLAREVRSPVNIPRFRRAAMDGFAVRAEDAAGATATDPRTLRLIGFARPARAFAGRVGRAEAVAIATGAPVPEGADAIVVVEAATVESGCVHISEAVAPGRHVARIGEDVSQGQALMAAGRRLRPQDVGLLAAVGVKAVEVVRRPRVAILATGDELLPPGSDPMGAAIIDSNSPMLESLIARDGGDSLGVAYLRDDPGVIRDGMCRALEAADIVLVTGGTSVGAEDHAPRLAAELGELAVHGIAMRPGSPTGIAFLPRPSPRGEDSPRAPFFLLPGNPVACLCAYDLFAGRVIRGLGSRSWELPYETTRLPLVQPVKSALGRTDYVRVRIEPRGVVPIATSGASILSSTVFADGFVLVPADRQELPAGEMVDVMRYGS